MSTSKFVHVDELKCRTNSLVWASTLSHNAFARVSFACRRYPVLQPVLQYGEQGGRWELQSWFVDANDRHYPVVTAPAVSVSPGDKITSYMSLSTDNSTWTVSGTNTNTGKDSTLRIAFAKAGDVNYDWAMLVNENINVNEKCFLMPESSNVTFTRLVTYLVTYCIW
jgi:hypothetical protein